MKKNIITTSLLTAAALMANAGESATGRMIVGDVLCGVSPDGTYATSEMNGTVVIYNLDTDEHYDYFADDRKYYGQGLGNCWSLNKLVGYTDMEGTSAVWRGGRWTPLPLAAADPAGMGNANGITPSGSRVCGNASTGAGLVLDEAKLMVYPCYWDELPNGNYGRQTPLPYPTKDFVGETPQYVTAISISEDGKTIFGQLTSDNGMMHELVIYRQGEDGEWTYEKPLQSLINPNKIAIPENPGEGPERPSEETFMDAEQLEQYDAAVAAWRNNPTGDYPQYTTFMTEEQIAQFNAVMKPYNEWSDKMDEYLNTVAKIMDESVDFCFNLIKVSPNGRYVAMAAVKSYFLEVGAPAVSFYTPYLYDCETGVATELAYPGASCLVTAVNNDGTVLGARLAGDVELGVVRTLGSDQWVTLGEHLCQRDPSFAQWVKDNWEHEVEVVIDEETGETDFQNLEITGTPFVSDDWNTFVSYAYNFWGGDGLNSYVSYIVKLDNDENAISQVESDGAGVARTYDLQGRIVTNAPGNGLYIRSGRLIRL